MPPKENRPAGRLFETIKELYGNKEIVQQVDVLRVAGRISDHVPLVMEAKVL